jgi:antitoxin VapB
MKSGAAFESNTSQAVRLPKEVAFPDSVKRVDIIPMGRARLIVPVGEGWASWFEEPGVQATSCPCVTSQTSRLEEHCSAEIHAGHKHRDLHDEEQACVSRSKPGILKREFAPPVQDVGIGGY